MNNIDNKIETNLPSFFNELLQQQYSAELISKIIEGYLKKRKVTLRVNTLKTTAEKVKAVLTENNIQFSAVPWSKEALIIENATEEILQTLEIYKNGEIYLQSLSSMLPPIILKPQLEEDILDMCAAPRWKNNPNCGVNKQHSTYNCM